MKFSLVLDVKNERPCQCPTCNNEMDPTETYVANALASALSDAEKRFGLKFVIVQEKKVP